MSVNYLVNDNKHSNPISAYIDGKRLGVEPELGLPHEVEYYDYTKKPTKSIEEIEDQLVAKIIGMDKPIRIVYSGGTDSYAVARAFARNKVDVKYTMLNAHYHKPDSYDSPTFLKYKISLLKELNSEYGLENLDVEIIDGTINFVKEFYSNKRFYEEDNYYGTSGKFSINCYPRMLHYSKFNPEHYINVFGMEKPRLYQDGIGIYWQVTDTMTMYGYSDKFDCLWFYISPLAPELIAKQCWNVIDHCNTKWPNTDFNISSNKLQTNKNMYHEWCRSLGRNPPLFVSLKSRELKPLESTYIYQPRFTHLNYTIDERSKEWVNFENLMKLTQELTGTFTFKPVKTKRFYLTVNI